MSNSSNQAFFQAQGAVGICRSFANELSQHGKLFLRGDPSIDAFVEAINKQLAEASLAPTEPPAQEQ